MNWARLHLDNVRISERRWRLLTACFPKASFHATKVDKIIKTDGIDNSLCPYATLPKDWNDYLDSAQHQYAAEDPASPEAGRGVQRISNNRRHIRHV